MHKFVWTGVGSREVPEEIAEYQRWVGHQMALLGGKLSTGDAIGSDENFLTGYNEGIQERDGSSPAEVHYTWRKNKRGLVHCPARGFHEAERYDTFDRAQEIAHVARGSFNGLFPSGIALHTRNAFQVLGVSLDRPAWLCVLYARPIGKRGNVKGGTNTAKRIADMNNIPVVNIYLPEEREKLTNWINGQLTKIKERGVVDE